MPPELLSFILENDSWIRRIHVTGAVVALTSVTLADLLLVGLKLKPGRAGFMVKASPFLSLGVWLGLMVLAVTGLLLFLPREGLEQYSVFQVKMALVLLVFLNGIFLNVWVPKRFEALVPEWGQKTERVRKFMVIAGISTAVSFVGWWGTMLLMLYYY
jgi:hypothetical protein